MKVNAMETRPYNPTESEPPESPPPFDEFAQPQQQAVPTPEIVPAEQHQAAEREVDPDKLAWAASHRKEVIGTDRYVEQHARKSMNMENEAIEGEYEQRAEKRGDDSSSTPDPQTPATSVGEIVRQQSAGYSSVPTQAQVNPPSVPAYNNQDYTQQQDSGQPPDSAEDNMGSSSEFSMVMKKIYSDYRQYIVSGFFFGVVLAAALLVVWLVIN